MNPPSNVLRFRPAGSDACTLPGAQRLTDVFLNEDPKPAGHVVLLKPEGGAPARWAYVLSDSRATGLQSIHSRQDLEEGIREYYFQELTADGLQSA
jgi:hypothetical protein